MDKECIGQGRTAEVFPAGNGRIIKLYRQFISAKTAQNEFTMSQCAYDNGIKTPRPYAIGMYEDRCGITYEKINGKTLLQIIIRNPFKAHAAAKKLAELHYSIHRVCTGSVVNNQKAGLRNAVSAAPLLNDGQKSEILSYLDIQQEEHTLCHGDFHPDNIMTDGRNYWIIDWMTGCEGTAACDVARTVMILRYSAVPGRIPRIIKLCLQYLQKKLSCWYKAEYMHLSGLKKRDIDRWMLPNYAARLVENLSPDESAVLMDCIKREIANLHRTAFT
jgi:uncharacterized protein (TIGR02172 family)